jgi:hypothetical protein
MDPVGEILSPSTPVTGKHRDEGTDARTELERWIR